MKPLHRRRVTAAECVSAWSFCMECEAVLLAKLWTPG